MGEKVPSRISNTILSESASLLHGLFVKSLDSVFVCDMDGRILLANPVACRTFAYDLDELMTLRLSDLDEGLFGADDEEVENQSFSNVKDEFSNAKDEHETVYTKKNGESVPVRIRLNPILFSQKDCLLAIVRDITHLKRQEEELRHANKMNAIGQLAGGIAHDFNNILGGVMGYAELALEDSVDGSIQYTNLEKLLEAADRAKTLVQQILTFSRKSSPKKDVVQLVSAVKDVVQFLSGSIPSSVVIEASILKKTSPIVGDASKIHELLINLANNAVHAMREDGVLRILLDQIHTDVPLNGVIGESPPGDYAMIQVEDTGCGIEPSLIHMIFEPFFSTKQPDEGTGMGLPVVFGIVRSHNGNIQVQSTPSVGTTFKIFFPTTSIPTMDAPTPYELEQGGGTILVVDDEDLLIDIFSKVLKSFGYNVIATKDVNEALDVLQDNQTQVDVLLTDQTMPQMLGIELATRAMEIQPGLPVILCSGYSKNLSEDDALKRGISVFLQKPVRKKVLAAAIKRAMKTGGKSK